MNIKYFLLSKPAFSVSAVKKLSVCKYYYLNDNVLMDPPLEKVTDPNNSHDSSDLLSRGGHKKPPWQLVL
jgi:hypothetical protein